MHPLAAPRPAAAPPRAPAGVPPGALAKPRVAFDPAPAEGRPAPSGERAEAAPEPRRFARHPDREADLALETREIELGWADLLDVINPLQHIPVVASLYRAVTGDEISAPARIMGGALFGGPVGLVAGVVNAIAEEMTGRDFGDMAIAAVVGDDAPAEIEVARSAPGPTGPPPPAVALSTAAGSPAMPELTGDAALAAFFADLRSAGRTDGPILPEPTVAAAELAVPERAERPAPRNAPGTGAPRHVFTGQMMDGLDKYRAMMIERREPGRPAAGQLDRAL